MSVVVKRSVTIEGHKTSVTLEDEFWDALRVIAQRDKTTMVSLVHQINQA
jgi:predicted DNA-binding ribbon-helix-helix protein